LKKLKAWREFYAARHPEQPLVAAFHDVAERFLVTVLQPGGQGIVFQCRVVDGARIAIPEHGASP
ncbi:MAG TPA: hypothetical protein PLR28_08885, partial [Dokdonella sp.]|nr:hypothetical protein [Dokdonella sp.]